MNQLNDPAMLSLTMLGWSDFFADQVETDEALLEPMRIASVHRAKLHAESTRGSVKLGLHPRTKTTDFAVGDWVLVDPLTDMVVRRLDRKALLQRGTEGSRHFQLIAANVDTLFIVTSCNDDFNPARLERYLALANESGTNPVILLTKVDQVDDAEPYRVQAEALQRDLTVVMLNGKTPEAADALAPWCGIGQTVALIGSSGVGKSTLLNTLTAKSSAEAQLTGSIRDGDDKGRHTTTSRSLHSIEGRGWVIDTPGMRTMHVSEVSSGLDVLFAEFVEIAPNCKFRDCTHDHEPGCAIRAAIAEGTLDPARFARWRKLLDENASNSAPQAGTIGYKALKSTGRRK